MSEVGFAVVVRAGAAPCDCRTGTREVGTGRDTSGAIIEKVRARTKRIRFTVTPVSVGLGPGFLPVFDQMIIERQIYHKDRRSPQRSIYLDSLTIVRSCVFLFPIKAANEA